MAPLPKPGSRLCFAEFDHPDDVLAEYRWWQLAPARDTRRPLPAYDEDLAVERWRKARQLQAEGDLSRRKLAVRRMADGVLVGSVARFDVNPRGRSCEIGYRIGPDFQRRGYATEAVSRVLDFCFEVEDMHHVAAHTGSFNQPSLALLRKLGFHQDGRLRETHELHGELHDTMIFSILAREWAARARVD